MSFFKKGSFKGKSRSLADIPAPSPRAPPAAAAAPAPPPPRPPPGPPPGPDNRGTRVVTPADAPPARADDPSLYKLTGDDVRGIFVGEHARTEKTFADVNRSPRAQSLVANVRFQILIDKKTVSVEAKFQTAEKLDALYAYLEREVFASVQSFEIRFLGKPIPRDGAVTMASQKICGPIMLNVAVQGKATLKVR
jgi:hypothetical protein